MTGEDWASTDVWSNALLYGVAVMTTLTVAAKGPVTLRKDLLQQLGVAPDQKLDVTELPGGRIEVKAARSAGTIEGFIGLAAGKSGKAATLDELHEAVAKCCAGKE